MRATSAARTIRRSGGRILRTRGSRQRRSAIPTAIGNNRIRPSWPTMTRTGGRTTSALATKSRNPTAGQLPI